MKTELTERQRNILNWIIWFTQYMGFPPSRREIAAEFGFISPTVAQDAVCELKRKGWIVIHPRIARGIVVL